MKKNILFIIIAFAFFAMSCEKEHKVEFYELGSEFYISSTSMTSLDEQTVVTIQNPLNNLTSIAVTNAGIEDAAGDPVTPTTTDLGSVSISGGEGTITLSANQLGVIGAGWSADLEFDAEINGKSFMRSHHVSVKSPFTTQDPGIAHHDKDYQFKYAVEPVAATVSNVTIETKLFYNGTYVAETGPFAAIDSVAFNGSAYNVGDTIYVRITATAGTKTDVEVTKLVVSQYYNVGTFSLGGNDPYDFYAFDLTEGKIVMNNTDSADVFWQAVPPFSGGTGQTAFALASGYNMVIMQGTDDDYANADIITISTLDFSGATAYLEVKPGDVIHYRTYRNAAPAEFHYGVMKILSTNMVDGDWINSLIEIEYKY